jgi:hypothetical protein
MRTIELLPGTTIDRAAALLVKRAPACADFNGIAIRARYATTRPLDIVARFQRLCGLRAIQWRASPEGRAQAERDAREIREQQANVDALVAELPALDLASPDAALGWLASAIGPLDRCGVRVDRGAIAQAFEAAGWVAGACCDDAFDGESADVFARWIVGQFLSGLKGPAVYPGLVGFVDDWRAKFRAVEA